MILGNVIDLETGLPIEGATVQLINEQGKGSITNSEGNFSLEQSSSTEDFTDDRLVVRHVAYNDEVTSDYDLITMIPKSSMLPDVEVVDDKPNMWHTYVKIAIGTALIVGTGFLLFGEDEVEKIAKIKV